MSDTDEIKPYSKISHKDEVIASIIVNATSSVHKELGPDLLERVYEVCFCHELDKAGLHYKRQVEIPIVYKNITFNEGLRLDILVENSVICELKAIDIVNPVWEAQIISHLKLAGKRLGFLINFNVPLMNKASNATSFNFGVFAPRGK